MILLIGNTGESSTGDIPDEPYIAKALNFLGKPCVLIDRAKYREELVGYQGQEIDFVFVANNNFMRSADIEWIRETIKAPVVWWTADQMDIPGTPWEKVAKSVDLWLGKDHTVEYYFKMIGTRYHYWNMDCAPDTYAPMTDEKVFRHHPQTPYPETGVDVGFIGNWTHDDGRTRFFKSLQELLKEEIHITTFTKREFEERGVKNVHHPVFGDNFCRVVGITKINLSQEWSQANGFWSNRIAKLMCAGGFVLASYNEGMEKRFGDKIVYYYGVKDCVNKIKYYLGNEDERIKIAQAGYEWANQALRFEPKVQELIDYLDQYPLRR